MNCFPTVQLGEVCERVSVGHVGTTTPYYCENGIPFLRTQNVGVKQLLLEDIKFITKDFHNKLRKSQVRPGDVLISRVISNTVNCAVVSEDVGEANCANVILVRPGPKLDAHFLKHFIASPENQSNLLNNRVGSAQSVVNTSVLKGWEIPLPPLPEQKRIAAILDKADSIRRKRQEAVRLTEELLRSVFLDMFGDPVTNPKGWDVKPLCELVNFTTGKLDSNAAVNGGAYPFFTCSRDDLQIDTFAFDCEALLLAGNNASADYSVKHYKGKFNAYQRTYVITMASPSLSYRYMQYALEMKLLDMKRLSKGTNTKYLTLGILDELLFQVPDNVAQSKFEKIIDKLNIIASKLRLAESVTDKSFSSLLQGAFRGELSDYVV